MKRKRSILSVVMVTALVLSLFFEVPVKSSGAKGTKEDCYISSVPVLKVAATAIPTVSPIPKDVYRTISTAEDFSRFLEELNGGKINFDGKLVVIDQDIQMNPNLANNTMSATTRRKNFKGILDGQGHTISNIDISGVGDAYLLNLFGGTVKNLKISNSTFKATGDDGWASGLVGSNYGTISNCIVMDSTIEADYSEFVGGISSDNNGEIINCASLNNKIEVSRASSNTGVGGVCGKSGYDGQGWSLFYDIQGKVVNCCNTSSIALSAHTMFNVGSKFGGIAGSATQTVCYNCFNSGVLTVPKIYDEKENRGSYVGGLIGYLSGSSSISYSFWSTESCQFPFGKSEGIDKACESYSATEMTSPTFLSVLNSEAAKNEGFSTWVTDSSSGYPTPQFPGTMVLNPTPAPTVAPEQTSTPDITPEPTTDPGTSTDVRSKPKFKAYWTNHHHHNVLNIYSTSGTKVKVKPINKLAKSDSIKWIRNGKTARICWKKSRRSGKYKFRLTCVGTASWKPGKHGCVIIQHGKR